MRTERLTGSYYTCQRIAQYVARRAIPSPSDVLLEPSFGDGVFLEAAAQRFHELGNDSPVLLGVEIQPEVFSKYALTAPPSFSGSCADFIDYRAPCGVSVVIGNPPYISLRNLNRQDKTKAINCMAEYQIKMSASASLWMPFVIHASKMLFPGGRIAFVLPFEMTYVKYAYPLWTYLGENFGKISVIRVYEDFFPEVEVETVLLFAEQYGFKTNTVSLEIYHDTGALLDGCRVSQSDVLVREIIEGKKPFTSAMLNQEQRHILSSARKEQIAVSLVETCKFKIGYVCADKDFFHPSETALKQYHIPAESLIPCIRNGREINGNTGIGAFVDRRKKMSSLFFPQKETEADQNYIRHGIAQGVHRRYKCKQRTPWYITPDIEIPDCILTVFGNTPKLVLNRGKYAVSNSLLAGYLRPGVAPEQVVCMWYNSLTLLSIEQNVHSLGGGVLVLIPGETDRLEVIKAPPAEEAKKFFREIDKCILSNGVQAAYELGDQFILSQFFGFSDEQIQQIRDAVSTLRDWRLPNGRRKRERDTVNLFFQSD